MPYDVDRIRSWFPALDSGWAHFDGPGGTQTPRSVGEAISAALTGPLSNRGTSSPSERNAEDAVAGFRAAMADLLGADPRGIVEGRSATQLVYDFSRHLGRDWGVGDEIVVTRLDHEANVSTWRAMAADHGVTVQTVDIDPTDGLPEASAWSPMEMLTAEKKSLGFYITGHPLDGHLETIGQQRRECLAPCSSSTCRPSRRSRPRPR